MDEQELRRIIAYVRDFGEVDFDLELKRAWWNFDAGKEEVRREFRKDVAGMANALGHEDRPRHIVVGLDETGRLYPAKLPMDEAKLQNFLDPAIDPVPRVRFLPHTVDGVDLTVIRIEPPFDRPYVVADRDGHFVFLRRGTRVGMARRRDLDAMYAAGLARRREALELHELELRRLPHVRLRAALNSRSQERCNGSLWVKNAGEQALDVVGAEVLASGPAGETTFPLPHPHQFPLCVNAGAEGQLAIDITSTMVAAIATNRANPWPQLRLQLRVAVRAFSGVEKVEEVTVSI